MAVNKQKVVFDGIKLCNVHTGVHRYMTECLRELDPLLKDKSYTVELVYPWNKTINCPRFENIKLKKIYHFSLKDIKKYGKKSCVLTTAEQWWDIVLPNYVKRNNALFCGMVNDNPMGDRNIICLHDLLLVKPEAQYPKEKVNEYLEKYSLISKRCNYVVTVSASSKKDICSELGIPENKVIVIPNAWQHMERIESDSSVFTSFPQLKRKNYYYSLATLTPHKNYKWIIEVAKRNPNEIFAVAGKATELLKTDELKLSNIIYLGRVSDEENKFLMENCKAFIHPSFLEGFGIPPLEALSCGAPIIISNTSCLPEIYGDSAHYISPYKYDYNLDEILKENTATPDTALSRYSWIGSAKKWIEVIETVLYNKEI